MTKWIVMVDDDLDMHYIYQKVFLKIGLLSKLKLFESGKDALNFLNQHGADVKLIFSDVSMPSMDGMEMRAIIQNDSNSTCREIPFFFLSTSSLEKEVKSACDLLVQGFYQKGNTMVEMEKTIKGVINCWGKRSVPSFQTSTYQ